MIYEIEYFYYVTASYSEGESGPSNTASATPQEFVPTAPTNLQATAGDEEVTAVPNIPISSHFATIENVILE